MKYWYLNKIDIKIYKINLLLRWPAVIGHVEFVEDTIHHGARKFADGWPFGAHEHVVEEALRTILEIVVLGHEATYLLIGFERNILGDVVHRPSVSLRNLFCGLKS